MNTKDLTISEMIDRLAFLKSEIDALKPIQNEHDELLKTLRDIANNDVFNEPFNLESDNFILTFSVPAQKNVLNISNESFLKETGLYDCCSISAPKAKEKLKDNFDKYFHQIVESRKFVSLKLK
jgi:hypothetical protein